VKARNAKNIEFLRLVVNFISFLIPFIILNLHLQYSYRKHGNILFANGFLSMGIFYYTYREMSSNKCKFLQISLLSNPQIGGGKLLCFQVIAAFCIVIHMTCFSAPPLTLNIRSLQTFFQTAVNGNGVTKKHITVIVICDELAA
jgi:hypothetical protein